MRDIQWKLKEFIVFYQKTLVQYKPGVVQGVVQPVVQIYLWRGCVKGCAGGCAMLVLVICIFWWCRKPSKKRDVGTS